MVTIRLPQIVGGNDPVMPPSAINPPESFADRFESPDQTVERFVQQQNIRLAGKGKDKSGLPLHPLEKVLIRFLGSMESGAHAS